MANDVRQQYQIRKYVDDQGVPQVDFQCPNCGDWSKLVRHERLRALTFKCKQEECKFEENTSIDSYHQEEIH